MVYTANWVNICYLSPFTFEPQESVDDFPFSSKRSDMLVSSGRVCKNTSQNQCSFQLTSSARPVFSPGSLVAWMQKIRHSCHPQESKLAAEMLKTEYS